LHNFHLFIFWRMFGFYQLSVTWFCTTWSIFSCFSSHLSPLFLIGTLSSFSMRLTVVSLCLVPISMPWKTLFDPLTLLFFSISLSQHYTRKLETLKAGWPHSLGCNDLHCGQHIAQMLTVTWNSDLNSPPKACRANLCLRSLLSRLVVLIHQRLYFTPTLNYRALEQITGSSFDLFTIIQGPQKKYLPAQNVSWWLIADWWQFRGDWCQPCHLHGAP